MFYLLADSFGVQALYYRDNVYVWRTMAVDHYPSADLLSTIAYSCLQDDGLHFVYQLPNGRYRYSHRRGHSWGPLWLWSGTSVKTEYATDTEAVADLLFGQRTMTDAELRSKLPLLSKKGEMKVASLRSDAISEAVPTSLHQLAMLPHCQPIAEEEWTPIEFTL